MKNIRTKGYIALIPFLVFILIYLGTGLFLQSQGVAMAFYEFPSVTAIFIALLIAFVILQGTIEEKFTIFASGAGNETMITMLCIFLLAGAFSTITKAMGGIDATVNFGLSFIPIEFITAGIFVISSFLGLATGTSMGTISAIVPIALALSDKAGLNVALTIAACVGGAMFGDNLSMISDTTIAATQTQGCKLKDKFKFNIALALPVAILTTILLLLFGRPTHAVAIASTDYEFIKILPYILVFALALKGVHVIYVLCFGIFLSFAIGMIASDMSVLAGAKAIWDGFVGMNEVFFLSFFCGGIAALTTHYGGLDWLMEKVKGIIKGPKSAQMGIAVLVSAADIAVANNTVAILISGPIAKDLSETYRIDPRRVATLLDLFSCVFQGIIPYGAQLLLVGSLTGGVVDAMQVIPYLWYQHLLLIVALITITSPIANRYILHKNP